MYDELRATCAGRDVGVDGWPSVSVVMPVRNEAIHLERTVASVLAQEYPLAFDVCLSVGPSDDPTATIAADIAARESRVHLVDNPSGTTPAGLNAAIAATTGEVVVRVDGHAELAPGYLRRAVETMIRTGAVNVGGRQVPRPLTSFERAVAGVTTSRLGTGGATYRAGGVEGPVDTVYLGVFDRAAGSYVGWFAADLIRNQDYELNVRLREAGGIVWFDPELEVGYRPRGSWTALARQYHGYGYWKAEVLRRHPTSLRVRQVIPVLATLALGTSVIGSIRRPRLLAVPAGYAAVLIVATRGRLVRAGVLATIHLSWGAGFCRRWVDRGRTGRRRISSS